MATAFYVFLTAYMIAVHVPPIFKKRKTVSGHRLITLLT